MALALLDGVEAAVDMTIETDGSTAVSYKCMANYLSADFVRDFNERTTFCTTGSWRARTPGMRQMFGRIEGFASKGWAGADPLVLMATNTPKDFIFTVDTGCTLTGQLHSARDHTGMRAQGNSERGIDFESYGAVTSVWVVA